MSVTFRPLERGDFPLLSAWMSDPEVHRWWQAPVTVEQCEGRFGRSIWGDDPTELWLVLDDDRPVGFAQSLRFGDDPEHAAELERSVGPIDPRAAFIDYLIGSADDRGRGVGRRLVGRFTEELLARDPAMPYVLASVQADNRASWRALEHAGFEVIGRADLEPANPDDSRDHLVLRRGR